MLARVTTTLDQTTVSEPRSTSKILLSAAGRGIFVWLTYALVGTLFSWICLGFTIGTLWKGENGGLAHAAHAGPIVFLLLLAFPQFWVTMIYFAGLPFLSVSLGHGMAVRAAIKRVLAEKVDVVIDWVMRVLWPLCEKLSAQGGLVKVRDVARAIDERIQSNSSGTLRWLLRRVSNIAKLPELLAGGEFLAQVRNQPEEARTKISTRLEDAMRARIEGSVFGALLMVLGITLLSAVLILLFWPPMNELGRR